jgi:hypothetical protein
MLNLIHIILLVVLYAAFPILIVPAIIVFLLMIIAGLSAEAKGRRS